jgi:hypothetical protein
METEFSLKDRVLLFLYSTRHIVGSLAALAGLGLLFGGVIDKYWWAIVAALYCGGYLIVPRDDTVEQLVRMQFSEQNLRERLADLIKAARPRVPAEAAKLLEAIREHADLLLPKLKELTDRGALASRVHHDVLQMFTRYLPDTLGAYLRLPPAFARLTHDDAGRSPQALLVEQLKILEGNLGSAVKEAFAEDVATLEVQGRFLSEKFSSVPF